MPAPETGLALAQVDIWLARDPQLRDAALLERLRCSLSADDRARVARMHFPRDQHQQLITRGMVRSVLSRYSPEVAPADWRFERNAQGRPGVVGHPAAPASFNLTHTQGLVVMAVARSAQIGVDVEHAGKRVSLDVARRYFSPPEIAALESLPPPEQRRRFLRLWTLKESYLKAIGIGVTGGLASMTFHLDAAAPRFECAADGSADQWVFREFAIPQGYLLAMAYLDRTRAQPPAVSLRSFPSGEEEGAQA